MAKKRKQPNHLQLPSDYRIDLVLKTESPADEVMKNLDKRKIRMLHAAVGIATEAGELLDNIKKTIFYNKEIDILNIVEELGDIDWYITLMSYLIGYNMEKIKDMNNKKLIARYGDKFSNEKANNRDLKKEIKSMTR